MSSHIKIILVVILISALIFWNSKTNQKTQDQTIENDVTNNENVEIDTSAPNAGVQAFKKDGLKTNTSKTSIELNLVLDGGPGKDGIPALNSPKFTNIKEAEKNTPNDMDGLVVTNGKTAKFYPYSIMVWHEIVNDVVGEKPVVITFCPLCGSAIVFDTKDQFGVSGKLYESNLLMYDKKTESLWSQSIGTAVVGDRTGEKLEIYPSQVLTFEVFKSKWPDGQVLSTDTGHNRNYDFFPYGDYNENDSIYFPISIRDSRFPAKEIMYVVNAYGHSVSFPIQQLKGEIALIEVEGKKITGSIINGEIIVKDAEGKVIPGYHEMWFSWAIHHQDDGLVWQK